MISGSFLELFTGAKTSAFLTECCQFLFTVRMVNRSKTVVFLTRRFSMAYSGRFKPKNPQKYKGDPTNVTYRSLWEVKMMRYLDLHEQINWWQSEEIIIRYFSPVDQKWHRYYPDFVLNKSLPDGTTQTIMIEVKPESQTRPPDLSKERTKTGRKSTRYLNQVKTWKINEAKWKAATEFCLDRGWVFKVFTEYELGIKKRK